MIKEQEHKIIKQAQDILESRIAVEKYIKINLQNAFNHFHIFDDKFRIDDWSDCGKNIHPATKEQRDTLAMAMTNAGYRWDKEKLKLEKI